MSKPVDLTVQEVQQAKDGRAKEVMEKKVSGQKPVDLTVQEVQQAKDGRAKEVMGKKVKDT
jgi:hypothetical protein